ncbi:MAG: tetratricopeptide repeat protein [Thermoplasmata archaeon]
MARSRRLAAIMFTDLVGFTRLGQRDEEAALGLRTEHQALLRPLFAAHGGREVKTLGDGFLVEFPSALESVRCAVEIQEAMAQRNALPSSRERIALRVGIHVGEIVEEGDDIVGDAVNVASRIEPLAESGGICVTGSVFDQVRNKLRVPLEKLGSRALKNVEVPVDLYRVVLSGADHGTPSASADADPKLRLAVLPFANHSVDASDEYFADGLTDELISRSSEIPSLRVIARTSVRQYKDSAKSIRDVGHELGVGVVLEGSVRKAGHRVRITAQLVDARTEEHLWSSRYDRPLDDIFAIQDDIAGQISAAISQHLSGGRRAAALAIAHGPPDTSDLEAYTEFLRARRLYGEKHSEETIAQALGLFETAVRRDPGFVRARVGVAECLLWLGNEGAIPHADSVRRAREELLTALRQDEAVAEAHSALGGLLLAEDDPDGAYRESRRAMELNPSLSDPYRWLAQIAAGNGRIDEAVRLLEAAAQLDPADVNVISFLGRAYAYSGREADALAHWERTKSQAPFRTNAHRTEYYLSRGDYAEAERTLREMERVRPESVWTEMYRGFLAARKGDTDGARRVIERLDRRGQTGELTVFFSGFVHFALGERDEFVASMESAFRLHSLPLMELMYSRLFESARSDPRILDLLRRQTQTRKSAG